VVLDKELPVYEEYYRRSEAWSEGSMKRFHALMDARD
jgi:hypothetical protein